MYSMLVAVPCGRDNIEIMAQTKALNAGFIEYLQSKHAAGIINVSTPNNSCQVPNITIKSKILGHIFLTSVSKIPLH